MLKVTCMQLSDVAIFFEGKRKDPEMYGRDYLPEFCRVLNEYVPEAEHILEWGSGLTSQVLVIYALSKWNSESFVSVDENKGYQEAVFAGNFRQAFVRPVCVDTVGPRRGNNDPELNCSSYPLSLATTFDLIFIDGRRRMECALVGLMVSHPQTVVVLHDYGRTRYQAILALFETIEDGPQFRVMRPRANVLSAMQSGTESALAAVRGSLPASPIPCSP